MAVYDMIEHIIATPTGLLTTLYNLKPTVIAEFMRDPKLFGMNIGSAAIATGGNTSTRDHSHMACRAICGQDQLITLTDHTQ